MRKFILLIFSLFVAYQSTFAQPKAIWNTIIGSAYTENTSFDALQRMCDATNGRTMGSADNEKAMKIWVDELLNVGLEARYEKFKAKAWFRNVEDAVWVKSPFSRKLKAVPSTNVTRFARFEAPLIFANYGFDKDYEGIDVTGKIVLLSGEDVNGKEGPLRLEALATATAKGAKGVVFYQGKQGTLVTGGSGNYHGVAVKIPAFNITWEEGKWLQRLLDAKTSVTLQMETNSDIKEVETANLVYTLPGKVKDKIVIGCHFDSWDYGQGAVDNGLGSAIAFDMARILKKYAANNYYTIEFVWFNGEEMGLWGSKKYVEIHRNEPIVCMINMDMTGSPTGFNTSGFDEFKPFLENLAKNLNGFDLKTTAGSNMWTNSDHVPFYLAGIPTPSISSKADDIMYKFYHELGDTFDKVNKRYLSDAVAVIGVLVYELANATDLKTTRRSDKEMIEQLKKFKLDERLKHQEEWPFKE